MSYLESCPQKQRPARNLQKFYPDQLVERVLRIKNEAEQLADEQETLRVWLTQLQPWGDFKLPKSRDLGNLYFFFYRLDRRQIMQIIETELAYLIINRDLRCFYVLILSNQEPGLPFPSLEVPTLSTSEIRVRLEDVEDGLEMSETRRIGATRFIEPLRDYLNQALDASELNLATQMAHDEQVLFIVQCWCPEIQLPALENLSRELSLALTIEDPIRGEQPPTLVKNSGWLATGESLIDIYSTPAYESWDLSALVYISFVFFFGIIIADAGYGFVLLLFAWLLRPKLLANGHRLANLFPSWLRVQDFTAYCPENISEWMRKICP